MDADKGIVAFTSAEERECLLDCIVASSMLTEGGIGEGNMVREVCTARRCDWLRIEISDGQYILHPSFMH